MAKQKLDIDWDRLIRETEEIAEYNRIRREEEIKSNPLFTLTAEEVEENSKFLNIARIYLSKCLDEARLKDDIDGFTKIVLSIDNIDYLLTRIKQWQGT